MAKVKLNPVLEKFRGQVGDLVFKRYGDEVIVGRKPDRSGIQPTAAQLEHQARFRQAVLYGRLVMADPEKKTLYERAAKAKGKPLFALTVADFPSTGSGQASTRPWWTRWTFPPTAARRVTRSWCARMTTSR
ncbi:MAG: hypothetical protein FJZ86_09810 [Chloroflexi bacterium]|nr:hypothetical protein [Chloroflexota bacterium]